ncbi:MAG: Fic family protein [Bacteroidetes bacterium]|nr:Fic family protein [Bacteroidota bacterium]
MPAKDTSAITPFFPDEADHELINLVLELKGEASRLSGAIHPITASALAALVVNMNSYYSNLIEGHFTHPLDIEKALKKDYSDDEKKHLLQLESVAHVEVNKAMRKRLRSESINICSVDFICWLHREFYNHLPESLRVVKANTGDTWEVIPGELRIRDVEVGRHIAPSNTTLTAFMKIFDENYSPGRISLSAKRILSIAASHHRLAWIHPFQDGNGRVTRLFSEAYFMVDGLDANGLWSISRGLSFYKKEYYERLSNADNPRISDNDGRGNLSSRYLKEFCVFFLKTAIEQIKFMSHLFETDSMLTRIEKFVDLMAHRGELRPESKYVLKEVFLTGRISKTDVMRLTGKSDNVARSIMKDLLDKELLKTDSDDVKAGLVMNFPVMYAPYFFPKLYPAEIEGTILHKG